jgi:hypothetical protein
MMGGDPFDKMLEYSALIGGIEGTLNIHDAAIEETCLDKRDSLFRMHEAEATLNRVRRLLKDFQES